MAKQITHVSIFLASPSDLTEERAIVRNVVNELNNITKPTMNIHLDLLAWETDAYPSAGIDAQDVINRQIGNDYDIFIGMMWKKFGTPTSKAGSGTEEEFDIAYNKYVENKGLTKIMIYFSDKPVPFNEIDIEQIMKVKAFKERTQKLGILHWPFSDTNQFENILKIHLINQITDVRNGLESNNASNQNLGIAKIADAIDTPIISSEEEEIGYLDLMETFLDNIAQVQKILENMGGNIEELGAQFTRKTSKIEAINKLPNKSPHSYRLLVDSSAGDINNYVQLTNIDLPRYRDLFTTAIESFSGALTLIEAHGQVDEHELEDLLETIEGARDNIQGLAESVVGFRSVTDNWPPVTKTLSRANKMLRATLSELINEFTNSVTLLNQLYETANQILFKKRDGDSGVEEV